MADRDQERRSSDTAPETDPTFPSRTEPPSEGQSSPKREPSSRADAEPGLPSKSPTEPRQAAEVPVYESSGRGGRWLIPAGTFLVGVLLGAVLVGVSTSGQTQAGASGRPAPVVTTGPADSGSPVPDATIVVPAQCIEVANDSRDAGVLIGQAAQAARALDAARLADLVREMQDAQQKLNAGAEACRSAAASITFATPSVSG